MSNVDCSTSSKAVKVSNTEQLFPRFFGPSHKITVTAECLVYDYTQRLCPTYSGGFWEFYMVDGAFFMVPSCLTQEKHDVMWSDNCFEGKMSPEAIGITACLFAFNYVCNLTGSNEHIELYYNLLAFAHEHVEAGVIARAID